MEIERDKERERQYKDDDGEETIRQEIKKGKRLEMTNFGSVDLGHYRTGPCVFLAKGQGLFQICLDRAFVPSLISTTNIYYLSLSLFFLFFFYTLLLVYFSILFCFTISDTSCFSSSFFPFGALLSVLSF